MKSTNGLLLGLLFAAAGAYADETYHVVDASCAMTPEVIHDQATVCNSAPINLASAGPGSVYPSAIVVSGVAGVISKVNVRMLGVSHSNTSTVEAVLQPPTGTVIGITGGGFPIFNSSPPLPLPVASSATWTFSDQASDYGLFFRDGSPILNVTAPVSGTFLPRTFLLESLPAPAPAGLESQLLSSQIGNSPNGNWQLFVNQKPMSPQSSATGMIAGGWCLDIETTAVSTGCYFRSPISGAIAAGDALQSGRINRNSVQSLCTWPKTNSLFNSTPIRHDVHNFLNTSSQAVCFTASIDLSGCALNQTQMVVYNSFAPASPGNNILADAGYASVSKLQVSFNRNASQPFTIVVHEIVANSGCPAYQIVLEANTCQAPPGELIFLNGFD